MEAGSLSELEIFDPLLDAVVAVDKDFCVRYANEAFAHLCGSSVRRLLRKPKPLSDLVTLEDDFFRAPAVRYDDSLAKMYREVEFHSSSGTSGTVQFCIQEKKTTEYGSLWVIFLRDVTLEKSLHDKYKLQLQAKENVIDDLKRAQKKLQEYSEGLEAMVQERTSELREALDFQRATLNCLGQGFLVFNDQGVVLPEYSRICPEMFGREPAGVHVRDLLALEGKALETFNSFLDTAFMDAIPFEDLLELLDLPQVRVQGRTLRVDLYPMRDEQERLKGVVVVATDITKELQYEEQLGRQKALAEKVTQVLKHPKQYLSYIKESERLLDRILQLATAGDMDEAQEEVTRGLHTVKGGASSFYLSDFVDTVHGLEQKVKAYYHEEGGAELDWALELGRVKRSFKWSRKEVDDLLGIESRAEQGGVEVPSEVLKKWCRELEKPSKALTVSQEIFREYLCESVEDLLGHLNEETQKLASLLGKKVYPLAIHGSSVRLLPEFYQGVIGNLVHCVRNAVDHGLEPEQERVELGKHATGLIEISVSVSKGPRGRSEVHIIVEDDGRGLDEAKLRAKHPRGDSATREEVLLSIFADGFSTKEEVTSISGMGVGMSSLKAEVEKIGGSVVVESEPLRGTKIHLIMPRINSLSDYVGFLMFRPKAS